MRRLLGVRSHSHYRRIFSPKYILAVPTTILALSSLCRPRGDAALCWKTQQSHHGQEGRAALGNRNSTSTPVLYRAPMFHENEHAASSEVGI